MNSCRILCFALFLISIKLHSVVLTFAENEYLQSKPFFVALVTNSNFPYEYINENGQVDGINVHSIRMIFEFTRKPVVFITNVDDFPPDVISSLAGKHDDYRLNSQSILVSDVFFLRHSRVEVTEAERFIVVSKEILANRVSDTFPNKNIIIADNALKAYQLFRYDQNSVLVFGSFFIDFFRRQIRNEPELILEARNDFAITFNLSMNNPNLYNIVVKSIQNIMIKSSFTRLFSDFRRREMLSIYAIQYKFYMQVAMFFFILLVLFCIYLLFKFKAFSFKSEKLIDKYYNDNNNLNLEIEQITSQLESSKSSYIHFLDNVNSLAFLLDLNGNIVHINQYSKILLGFQPENLIGHNIETIVSPEYKQKLLNLSVKDNLKSMYSHAISSYSDDASNPYEIEITTKEGLKKSFIFSVYFTKSINNVMQISYILQNISDRKSLENRLEAYKNHLEDLIKQRIKQLKESEERLSFVIDKAYNSIFTSLNNCFTLVNEALCIMTGYTKEDFLSKKIKFTDIIAPNHREEIINKIEDFMKNNIDYFVLETNVVNYNGAIIEIEIHITTVKSEGENIILGVINEIAVKKELENKKLEAERLKMISTLSVTANDKINSPLLALQGYVELLEIKTPVQDAMTENTYKNIYLSISTIKSILDKLQSLTSVTISKYNYDDLSMIDIMSEFNVDEENLK